MSKAGAVPDHGALEDKLGYRFRNGALLVQALTHISLLASEKNRIGSYQRLEFLGDRVLGLVVSAMLYAEFPQAAEGELSRRLAALVRRETCADVAEEWGVGASVRLGESELQAGGRGKPAILSDVCEAVIGAVFLDGGYAAAQTVIEAVWEPRMRQSTRPLRDPKTALQEWAQSLGKATPVYQETARSGPAHAPAFTISVIVEGWPPVQGTGPSKRIAEQAAADAFMTRQGLTPAREDTA